MNYTSSVDAQSLTEQVTASPWETMVYYTSTKPSTQFQDLSPLLFNR